MRMRVLAGLVVTSLLLAGCTAEASDKPVFRFSAIPDEGKAELELRYGKLAGYLTRKLGVKCEFKALGEYDHCVAALRTGDIHAAWFGGLSGVQARELVPGAEAILCGESDTRFKSYFIAHKDTGLQFSKSFPMGMKGKTFTFGPEGSTSGRLMPQYFAEKNAGMGIEEFISGAPGFSGSHPKTAEWVQNKTFETGALNFKVYERLVKAGKIDPKVCVKIWETPEYYDYNFTIRPSLDDKFGEGFTQRLEDVLIGSTAPEVLEAFARKQIIACQNSDFDVVRVVASTTKNSQGKPLLPNVR